MKLVGAVHGIKYVYILKRQVRGKGNMERELNFYCKYCDTSFKSEGYDNPVYLADKVANCPECGSKTWPDYEACYKNLVREIYKEKDNG